MNKHQLFFQFLGKKPHLNYQCHNLFQEKNYSEYNEPFNFSPSTNSNCKVEDLIKEIFRHWEGNYSLKEDSNNFKEANLLSLSSEKAKLKLGWESIWNFNRTVEKTVMWYKKVEEKK